MTLLPNAVAGKVYIYALVDPRTEEVRYVGKTTDPRARSYNHRALAQTAAPAKKAWIAELKSARMRPIFCVLDLVPEAEWDASERRHITNQRLLGASLTNANDGGRCASMSAETRAKIAAAKRGVPRSAETKAKLSASKKGMLSTEKAREMQLQSRLGRKDSPETIAKRVAATQATKRRNKS